jgi:hypothetical protein
MAVDVPELTTHSLESEVERLRRSARRDRAALEGLVEALRRLQRAARALKAENAELRAQLGRAPD